MVKKADDGIVTSWREAEMTSLAVTAGQGQNSHKLSGRMVVSGILLSIFILSLVLMALISGCSMSEELKRIEKSEAVEDKQDASRSSSLTGEQLFVRSCNTCHPGGKAGVGPSLENLEQSYPDDKALKALIRKGKGIMPGQPVSVITDVELDNLVEYLRALK